MQTLQMKTPDESLHLLSTIGTNYEVDCRWIVKNVIGKGGFSVVFNVTDKYSDQQYAMKFEKPKGGPSKLFVEAGVLHRMSDSEHCCKFINLGQIDGCHYLVMTVVGKNLAVLKRQSVGKRFDFGTVMRLGVECTRALQDLHNVGYIHRDIKPSNFAIGLLPENQSTIYVLDFGLSLQLDISILNHQRKRVPRFVGTTRFASRNIHMGRHTGRHDDIISLMYMLAFLHYDKLPWTGREGHQMLGRLKYRATASQLFNDMPLQVHNVYNNLLGMDIYDFVEYDRICDVFQRMAEWANAPQKLTFRLVDDHSSFGLQTPSAPFTQSISDISNEQEEEKKDDDSADRGRD